jgi:hypothetical protein
MLEAIFSFSPTNSQIEEKIKQLQQQVAFLQQVLEQRKAQQPPQNPQVKSSLPAIPPLPTGLLPPGMQMGNLGSLLLPTDNKTGLPIQHPSRLPQSQRPGQSQPIGKGSIPLNGSRLLAPGLSGSLGSSGLFLGGITPGRGFSLMMGSQPGLSQPLQASPNLSPNSNPNTTPIPIPLPNAHPNLKSPSPTAPLPSDSPNATFSEDEIVTGQLVAPPARPHKKKNPTIKKDPSSDIDSESTSVRRSNRYRLSSQKKLEAQEEIEYQTEKSMQPWEDREDSNSEEHAETTPAVSSIERLLLKQYNIRTKQSGNVEKFYARF